MTSEKAYALEARVDTQVTEGWSIPWEAVKSADEGRTSTTLTNDGDLQFTNVPIGDYMVDVDIFYSGGTGASETDLKIDFNLPGSVGSLNLCGFARVVADPGSVAHQATVTGTVGLTVYTAGTTTVFALTLHGQMHTAAVGTFVLRWAAGTNNGTNTKIYQYSRMAIARRN